MEKLKKYNEILNKEINEVKEKKEGVNKMIKLKQEEILVINH
jgi:hypothetical protein